MMLIIIGGVTLIVGIMLLALIEKVDKDSAKINKMIKERKIRVSKEIKEEVAEYVRKKDEKA